MIEEASWLNMFYKKRGNVIISPVDSDITRYTQA